ncbi:GNAT family N-acetyltransferase [Amycolatopsis sp. FDAARGOS 1241]|uniref:GNAT family N-acetyltransferase n=1 Tax=Amycolatopsis sp. FDAARGOS 1241 TaxID=2778070 RepID=UPI00195146FB|nr:GNAT family N-acetyltransferase [Amycolatopsis sp. FDAARGOS 1241]QRP44547.1 GNAT family N-acetyltransferase [Amycolatopsis sp. FDAARGOS 1241]
MGDVEIRPPRPEEFAVVGDLTVEAYRADGLLAEDVGYEKELRDVAHRAEHAELLVAVADGSLAGTVAIVHPGTHYAEISRDGELEFRMLAVSSAARGRGIGEALTRAVLTRGRALGLRRVVLSSLDRMRTAHRLYERIGFRRLPARDWRPFPTVTLIAYEYDL